MGSMERTVIKLKGDTMGKTGWIDEITDDFDSNDLPDGITYDKKPEYVWMSNWNKNWGRKNNLIAVPHKDKKKIYILIVKKINGKLFVFMGIELEAKRPDYFQSYPKTPPKDFYGDCLNVLLRKVYHYKNGQYENKFALMLFFNKEDVSQFLFLDFETIVKVGEKVDRQDYKKFPNNKLHTYKDKDRYTWGIPKKYHYLFQDGAEKLLEYIKKVDKKVAEIDKLIEKELE
jgi:hypothetical protein